MSPATLIVRDLDLVERIGVTTAERHELDSRLRLVGRRDHDASTRELETEGDAPGSVEDLHARHLGGAVPADPPAGRHLARPAHAIARIEELGVLEGDGCKKHDVLLSAQIHLPWA